MSISKRKLRRLVAESIRDGKNSISLGEELVHVQIKKDKAEGILTGIICYPDDNPLSGCRLEIKTGAGARRASLGNINLIHKILGEEERAQESCFKKSNKGKACCGRHKKKDQQLFRDPSGWPQNPHRAQPQPSATA